MISWQPQLQILIPHFTSLISTMSKESVGDLPIRVHSRGRGVVLADLGAVGKTAGGFRSSSHTKTLGGSFAFAQLRLGALSGVIFVAFAFVFCPAENVD